MELHATLWLTIGGHGSKVQPLPDWLPDTPSQLVWPASRVLLQAFPLMV